MSLTDGNALDFIFSGGTDAAGNEKRIQEISLVQLHDFAGHTYKVLQNQDMEELMESIQISGILEPLVVRPCRNGNGYEVISGHRRKHAADQVGLSRVPCWIVDMNDDEATIAMVDANLKRTDLSISETAKSLKAKADALSHMGKSGPRTADRLGEDLGKTGRSIERLIRLAYLTEELLELVDTKQIGVSAGYLLSFLSADQQCMVYEIVSGYRLKPSTEQAQQLKENMNVLNKEMISSILTRTEHRKKKAFTIKNDRINSYFDEDTDDSEKERIILAALEEYRKNHS